MRTPRTIFQSQQAALKFTIEDVWLRMREHGVRPAFPTVAQWLNGKRKPRDMKNLEALCLALELELNDLTRRAPRQALTAEEDAVVQRMRKMTPKHRELYLAQGEALVEASASAMLARLPHDPGGTPT